MHRSFEALGFMAGPVAAGVLAVVEAIHCATRRESSAALGRVVFKWSGDFFGYGRKLIAATSRASSTLHRAGDTEVGALSSAEAVTLAECVHN
jgi:hypothetical protein